MDATYQITLKRGAQTKSVEITDDEFMAIIEALAEARERHIELSAPVQQLMNTLKAVF
jgi:isopropylmalate/homocitrate/citramalate synthase